MVFNNECRLVSDPASEQRIAISRHPEYVAEAAGRR